MKSRGLGKVSKIWFLKDKPYLFVHKMPALDSKINFGVTLSRKVDRCTFYIKACSPYSHFLINVKTMWLNLLFSDS